MTALAAFCAGLAVLLAIPPRPRRPEPAPRSRGPSTGLRWRAGLAAIGAVAAVWLLAGTRTGVLVTAAAAIAGTGARVLVTRRRASARRRAAADVARACAVLAAEMELGKIPVTALSAAAEDCPVLRPGAAYADIGGDLVEVWTRQAEIPGQEGLAVLARAWHVATVTGAPLAPSLDAVATALRADEEVDRLVAGELAAPRLTGVLLALLPLAGVTLGYLIGGDPVGFLLGTPWGWGCLLAGSLLACTGVLWTDHLAAGD